MNLILDKILTNILLVKKRGQHHGYQVPFMFTLHFKGVVSPHCNTLVKRLQHTSRTAHEEQWHHQLDQ